MHTLLPILVHGIRCAYGQVAEEAEAMAPMGLLLKLCNACGTGMMAWGPDRAECIASLHSLHKYHMSALASSDHGQPQGVADSSIWVCLCDLLRHIG